MILMPSMLQEYVLLKALSQSKGKSLSHHELITAMKPISAEVVKTRFPSGAPDSYVFAPRALNGLLEKLRADHGELKCGKDGYSITERGEENLQSFEKLLNS
jgi:hypothetical protein